VPTEARPARRFVGGAVALFAAVALFGAWRFMQPRAEPEPTGSSAAAVTSSQPPIGITQPAAAQPAVPPPNFSVGGVPAPSRQDRAQPASSATRSTSRPHGSASAAAATASAPPLVTTPVPATPAPSVTAKPAATEH